MSAARRWPAQRPASGGGMPTTGVSRTSTSSKIRLSRSAWIGLALAGPADEAAGDHPAHPDHALRAALEPFGMGHACAVLGDAAQVPRRDVVADVAPVGIALDDRVAEAGEGLSDQPDPAFTSSVMIGGAAGRGALTEIATRRERARMRPIGGRAARGAAAKT